MRHTHTFAILPVSQSAYEEVAGLLRAAGYDHVFSREGDAEIMCMQGIALKAKPEPEPAKEELTVSEEPRIPTVTRTYCPREDMSEATFQTNADEYAPWHGWPDDAALVAHIQSLVSIDPEFADITYLVSRIQGLLVSWPTEDGTVELAFTPGSVRAMIGYRLPHPEDGYRVYRHVAAFCIGPEPETPLSEFVAFRGKMFSRARVCLFYALLSVAGAMEATGR